MRWALQKSLTSTRFYAQTTHKHWLSYSTESATGNLALLPVRKWLKDAKLSTLRGGTAGPALNSLPRLSRNGTPPAQSWTELTLVAGQPGLHQAPRFLPLLHRMEEMGGERRCVFIPLSSVLSPLVPRGERMGSMMQPCARP